MRLNHPDELTATYHKEGMFSDYSDEVMGALRTQWSALRGVDARMAREGLIGVIGGEVVGAFEQTMSMRAHRTHSPATSRTVTCQGFDGLFARAHRRRQGMYYTPANWAELMASALVVWGPEPQKERWHVADLAAGDGALLCAALRARPDCTVLGVEQELASALSAAMHIVGVRIAQGWLGSPPLYDRVIVGSGLAQDVLPVSQVECVLGNPPYLGEKGNRTFFEDLSASHPHLAHRIVARVDLLYLFMYRALDYLASGGVMVHLTSAYWLQATGAARLREDLLRRAQPVLCWQKPGERLFADAPGHHSLLTLWQKREVPDEAAHEVMTRAYSAPIAERGEVALGKAHELATPCVLSSGSEGFRPFVDQGAFEQARAFRAQSARLSEFFTDCQGFVSGADRVTRAHVKLVEDLEAGAPLFLFDDATQIPELLQAWRGDLVLPVLRASQLKSGEVLCAQDEDTCTWALYVDGALKGERLEVVEAHLQCARPILERRREVKIGRIPWYRMHWPRQRAEQLGDKLVMARRSAGWEVSADFAGHLVSSDCTYLRVSAMRDAGMARRALMRALVWIAQPEVQRDLEVYGKQKGELYEFYSEPLRDVPMALREGAGGELEFDERMLGSQRALALEREMWERIEQNQEST